MSLNCPLLKPSCKKSVVLGGKAPFQKPKCPLTNLMPKCPPVTSSKCPLMPQPCPSNESKSKGESCPFNFPSPCPPKCPLAQPSCPLSPPKCPLAQPPPCPLSPPKCPLAQPPPCPLSPPKCPLAEPPPCPLSPPKCPLAQPPPCPLSPPKCPLAEPSPCPLSPPKCPLAPPPCPLTVQQRPQCALLPPKCPLEPVISPVKCNPPPGDICPLDNPPEVASPCPHIQYLNKGLTKRPLSNPVPPPVCQELARKCPFEPKPMICHESCPCSEVPEVQSGPRCPFLPPDPPACPPICPLDKQPDCPLVQKPRCMWKPTAPTQCPLSPPDDTQCPSLSPPSDCALKCADLCPSFIKIPGKSVNREKIKPKTSNIQCCPFCEKKPVVKKEVRKTERSFHFPSCPQFKPSCQMESLPKDVASCPFYPCPCPLTGTDCCPIKVPPLQVQESECNSRANDRTFSKKSSFDRVSVRSECPSNVTCPAPEPSCPLANFKCPLADFKCPEPPTQEMPCPLKGCLKNSRSQSNTDCGAKNSSCSMFPEGRGSDEDLGLCGCDYPVPPCMVDMKSSSNIAPPQYCLKDDCCMGLPDPPINLAASSNDTFYSYVALHPEKESTKYYVEMSNEPPSDAASMTFGSAKEEVKRRFSVIKSGEGYKRCKTVQDILEKRGPCSDSASQYNLNDCPMNNTAKQIALSNKAKKNK